MSEAYTDRLMATLVKMQDQMERLTNLQMQTASAVVSLRDAVKNLSTDCGVLRERVDHLASVSAGAIPFRTASPQKSEGTVYPQAPFYDSTHDPNFGIPSQSSWLNSISSSLDWLLPFGEEGRASRALIFGDDHGNCSATLTLLLAESGVSAEILDDRGFLLDKLAGCKYIFIYIKGHMLEKAIKLAREVRARCCQCTLVAIAEHGSDQYSEEMQVFDRILRKPITTEQIQAIINSSTN